MQEKTLGQVLCLFGGVTPAPDVRVKRVPVDSAELSERRLEPGRPALGREQHHVPPSRTESVGVLPRRGLVRLHGSPPTITRGYHVQAKIEAKPFAQKRELKGRRLALRSRSKILLATD